MDGPGGQVGIDELTRTRRALHGVAELLVAGPAYADHGDIRLLPTPGGFGAWRQPGVRVDGSELVAGDRRVPLTGTIRQIGVAAGMSPRSLSDVYSDGAGVGLDDEIVVSAEASAVLAAAFESGGLALGRLEPGAERVLWPEHFDIGISVPEVNYGVSPGDGFEPWPYAYVGPWHVPPLGGFWNAPFGAAARLSELGGVDGIVAFFAEGRALLS